jgi:hypothetical protein
VSCNPYQRHKTSAANPPQGHKALAANRYQRHKTTTAAPAPQEMPQSDPEESSQPHSPQPDSSQSNSSQPDPQKIARYLHRARDQMALFGNLHAVHEVTKLQQLTRAIKGMGKDLKTIQKDVGKVQTDMTDMRTEMQAGFTRLETRISVVYVLILLRTPASWGRRRSWRCGLGTWRTQGLSFVPSGPASSSSLL